MNEKILKTKARAYALKNAIAYKGRANQGAVISGLFNEGLEKSDVKKYAKIIGEVVSDVNGLSVEEQEKEFSKLKEEVSERDVREGLPELPDAKKGKVVMRFAPSPSGPMHIGHALTSCLSFLFVKEYGGKFIVRIEDTNPENIYEPAYKMLEKESQWLFDGIAEVQIQSDQMETYYKYVKKLLDKDAVYICTCSSEDFKKFSESKKDCPCRKLSKKENIERWNKMLDDKGYGEGESVLRFKSDMKHKNPAMRDFPLARVNLSAHPRQKKKYRVWPLMNLAVSVDDIESKMTHIVRAKDHIDNARRQELIFNVLGKKFPWTGFLGNWHFKDMEISSTKMREAIEKGEYSGWDDAKLPTIASLKKRGYKPSAFWKFSERVGLTESDKVIDKKEYFQLLDTFNKD